MMFIRVDLPAPFSPMIECISPRFSVTETLLSACTGPNDFEMARRTYAQLVESFRDELGRPRQRTLATLGRIDAFYSMVFFENKVLSIRW